MGRLPVYLYDDFQWTPYEGTHLAIENFGFVSRLGQGAQLAEKLQQVNNDPAELDRRLQKVKEVRKYFTYEGILEQIELFFADPLGPAGGQLRCAPVPDTENRRRMMKQRR